MYISTYISNATFAWSWKLTVDIDSMGPGLQLLWGQFSNFLVGKVSLEFRLHGMSIFHDIQMITYFGTGWCCSHMVGYAGGPTYTAYVDMTLTRSKVKVTGLLNFRQLAKPCMLTAMSAAALRGFLVLTENKIENASFFYICSLLRSQKMSKQSCSVKPWFGYDVSGMLFYCTCKQWITSAFSYYHIIFGNVINGILVPVKIMFKMFKR